MTEEEEDEEEEEEEEEDDDDEKIGKSRVRKNCSSGNAKIPITATVDYTGTVRREAVSAIPK